MNIHSLTFDIHFCNAINISKKKKTPMKYLFNIEILFKSKIIAHNKLETKLHIYTPNIHSIHIMALHLA